MYLLNPFLCFTLLYFALLCLALLCFALPCFAWISSPDLTKYKIMLYTISLYCDVMCCVVSLFRSIHEPLSLYQSLPPFSSLCLSLSFSLSLTLSHLFLFFSSLPRFPIWTVGEYKLFDALIKVLCAIGLPMVLYFVISSLMDPKLRKTQYLRICYASTAIGLSVYVLGMADSPDKYFCKDNAISYNIIYDGKSFKILA